MRDLKVMCNVWLFHKSLLVSSLIIVIWIVRIYKSWNSEMVVVYV